MAITVTKSGGWGDRIKISNGITDLEVSTSFGPHIMFYGFTGKENFLYENPEMTVNNKNECMKMFGDNDGWYIYGGHRLWHSPEAEPRSYYPDNDPVEYTETKNGAIFLPPRQKFTNLQNEIEIKMYENEAKAEIIHRVTNYNAWPIQMAPWAITLMAHGGMEVVPIPQEDTGLLGNALLALWPYTKMNDERVYWGKKYITLVHNKNGDGKFKVGISNKEKFAAYFHHQGLFIKQFDYDKTATYPDGGMNFETFTSPDILECESIGKMWNLEYGQTAEHVETWSLYDGIEKPGQKEEKAIEEILNQYLK